MDQSNTNLGSQASTRSAGLAANSDDVSSPFGIDSSIGDSVRKDEPIKAVVSETIEEEVPPLGDTSTDTAEEMTVPIRESAPSASTDCDDEGDNAAEVVTLNADTNVLRANLNGAEEPNSAPERSIDGVSNEGQRAS